MIVAALVPLAFLSGAAAQTAGIVPPFPLPLALVRYPSDARWRGVTGEAEFLAQVDEQGSVTGVVVRKVPQAGLGFEEAVRDGVQRWKFRPARAEGRPRAGEYEGRVAFRLRPRAEDEVAALAGEFVRAWNTGALEPLVASFEVETGESAFLREVAQKSGERARAWAASQVADATRPQLRPGSHRITLMSDDKAYAMLGTESGGAASLLVGWRPDRWKVLMVEVRDAAGRARSLRTGGESREPKKVRNVVPAYPAEAKAARISGEVILECAFDEYGSMSNVKVLRGIPQLDQAAIDAVRQWVYEPALLNGIPVPAVMEVKVSFKLEYPRATPRP